MKFQARAVRLAVAAIPACILVLLFALAPALMAQVRSAQITGTVKDPSGAVVVDASVVVKNTDTQESYTSTTNRSGEYAVPYLQNGNYSVTVSKGGFKQFVVEALHLDPAQSAQVDATLSVGTQNEAVTVQASVLQIQTETSEVAGLTTADEIDSLPNITQNPLYYAGLQNGVTARNETMNTQSSASFGIGATARQNDSAYGVNGGRAFENQYQIDGLPVMNDGYNEIAVLPNLESMQEVQVHTEDFSAEYGQGASVISITTKSGTNDFHGQVSYLNRNDMFNANISSNKAQAVPIARPEFKVNDVGGAITGPIRKDHIFFTGTLHWLSHNQGGTSFASVPTTLERAGDFGATLISNSASGGGAAQPVRLWDPTSATAVPAPATNVYVRNEFPVSTNCPNATTTSGAPVPTTGGQNGNGCGDIIPNPSAVGLTLLSLYPKANTTPNNAPFTGSNYKYTTVTTYRKYTTDDRLDWKHGRHSIYGTGGYDWGTELIPPTFGTGGTVPGFNSAPGQTTDRNVYAQVGDTIVMSPSFFLDIRYGGTRTHSTQFLGRDSGFTQYGAFGINAATQALVAINGSAPATTVGTWTTLNNNQFNNKEEHEISHTVQASATKIKGTLEFKAGFMYHIILPNFTDFEEASANLGGCCANDVGNYTDHYVNATGGAVNGAPYNISTQEQGGYAGALTLVNEGVWFVRPGANLEPAYAAKDLGIYTQNNWRIKPNLTLNLGLRWDLQPGLTERYNHIAGYDFTSSNPFGALGAMDFPGSNGYSRNLWDTEWSDWQPVVGFNYRIMPTFVVHGGYRTTYLPSNTGYFASPNDLGESTWEPGNTGALTYGATPNGIPTEHISDAAPLVAATDANTSAPQSLGIAEAYFDRHLKNQIEKQASLFLEKSFGNRGQWFISTGWAGSWENHLSTRNIQFENNQSVSPTTLAAWRATYIATNGGTNPGGVQTQNPFQSANCGTTVKALPFQGAWAACTVPLQDTLYPFPLLFGGGLNGSRGFAHYNSLQTKFAHTAHGLHLEANFTWSKSLSFVTTAVEDGQGVDATGSISNTDLYHNRKNQNYDNSDQPLSFNLIAVYQSPFGQGGSFALSNPVARGLAGGWEVSGVLTMHDGFPLFVTAGSNGLTSRVNRIPGVPVVLPSSDFRAPTGYRYNGSTKVTLPCGVIVTPGNLTSMKYNLCAFQSPTVLGANGTTILADEFWYGANPNTFGDIRGEGLTNIDLTLRRQFPIYERFKLEISALAQNFANHPEYNAQPSAGAGGTDTVNNPANGQIPGFGSGGYGTYGMGTFDPRQIQLQGRIIF